ncbi:hypothetical protein MAPG_02828 [Magnaporthiopsis poae ATCC 64411]|uniref:Uncharacterized protein n=1 Tax=Magnaporthiopsis poae (strain ATCC 64411 / 73-15) TaxID=644358 RepID=A0A0C4DSE9_MAGP6|nr:hypothetical protein MAPG_02828 [Magnaporthiopsis poae ATCC 64411]
MLRRTGVQACHFGLKPLPEIRCLKPRKRSHRRPATRRPRRQMSPPPDTPKLLALCHSDRTASVKRQAVPLSPKDAPPNMRIRFAPEVAESPTVHPGRGRGCRKTRLVNDPPSTEREVDTTLRRGPISPEKPAEVSADITTKRGRGRPKKGPDIAKITVPPPESERLSGAIDGRRSRDADAPKTQARTAGVQHRQGAYKSRHRFPSLGVIEL